MRCLGAEPIACFSWVLNRKKDVEGSRFLYLKGVEPKFSLVGPRCPPWFPPSSARVRFAGLAGLRCFAHFHIGPPPPVGTGYGGVAALGPAWPFVFSWACHLFKLLFVAWPRTRAAGLGKNMGAGFFTPTANLRPTTEPDGRVYLAPRKALALPIPTQCLTNNRFPN